MKTKYNIYAEVDRNPYGQPIYNLVEVFKGDRNEANAIRFVENPQNLQRYGVMQMIKRGKDGVDYGWDENKRVWCKI